MHVVSPVHYIPTLQFPYTYDYLMLYTFYCAVHSESSYYYYIIYNVYIHFVKLSLSVSNNYYDIYDLSRC